jgi:hypothetical protein
LQQAVAKIEFLGPSLGEGQFAAFALGWSEYGGFTYVMQQVILQAPLQNCPHENRWWLV